LINLNLLIQMPLLAYVTVYHRDLVTAVFGGKFIDWSYLLPVVVGFSTLNVIDTSVTLTAQYRERAGIILASKALGIYNVLALLVLLPVLGLMGAVIASGSAQVLKNIYIWWFVRHEGKWLNWRQAMGACVLLWGGVVAICLLLKQVVSGHPMIQLLLGATVTGLAVLLHARSPALSVSDRNILGSVLSGREGRWMQIIGIIPRTSVPIRPDGPR
jgi:hypothetical protein